MRIVMRRQLEKAVKGKAGLALLPSKKKVGVRRWQRVGEKAQPPAKVQAKFTPSTVFRDIRGHSGEALGWLEAEYDGSTEDAVRAAKQITERMYAEFPDASNIQSRIGAVDNMGNPKYTISPNFKHVAHVCTTEARHIWGDVTARPKTRRAVPGSKITEEGAIRKAETRTAKITHTPVEKTGISKRLCRDGLVLKSKNVMRPGIRGGKFYFTRTGRIVYGAPPVGGVREAKPEETGKPGHRVGVRGKMQNMFLTLKKTGSILVSRTSIAGPEDAARMMSFLKKSDREKCYVINMDKNNKVLNIHLVSMGSLSASIVTPRESYKTALLSKAKKVWFVHNHPSGVSRPSRDDENLTSSLHFAGKQLGIEMLGHVVIGQDSFATLYPQDVRSVLSGPSPAEEERKKKVKVVTTELSEEAMTGVLNTSAKITSPADAARVGAQLLSPDKPMVAAIYLSVQRNVLGVETIGPHLKKLGRSTTRILKSSILHNADSVLIVASKNSKIDHSAYMEMNGKFEGLGIDLVDTVKCSTKVGESYISYKRGDNIFKSFGRFIQKAVVGAARPGHKYIKRVRTTAGRWRYYYRDQKTGRLVTEEEPKARSGLNKERLAKLIQMHKPKIESHLRPLIQRYRLSADAMPDLLSAYAEGALRSLQEASSSRFDPWLRAQKRGHETAKRWAQKQGPFKLPNPEQGYRDLMKIKAFQERFTKEKRGTPSEEEIATALEMRVDRVKELLAWDQLRGKQINPGAPGLPTVPSAEKVVEKEEEERERQRAYETVRKEADKLPEKQRKIAAALMGERGTLKDTRKRIGVSTGDFYREKEKVRRKLRKLKPIWVRFGKATRVFPFLR